MSPYRIVLIATFVPCLVRLLSGRVGPVNAVDLLVMAHGLWVVLALVVNEGMGQGVESGGIYVIEFMGAYLVARCWIRNVDSFVALSRLFCVIVVGMLVFTLPESLTGQHLLKDAFRTVLGGAPAPYIEPRLGLTRAFGSFDHPILYGIFCASTFAAAYYCIGKGRMGPREITIYGLVVLAMFLSLSSGAYVAFGIQAMFIAWDRFTRGISGRWAMLAGIFAAAWTMLSLLSNRSPVHVFISYLTFSAHSAYNRILIWEFGSQEVARHPMFGIGFGDWQRPDWMHSGSMDNFWLLTAVRYGLPALILLVGAVGLTARRLAARGGLDAVAARARAAWLVGIAGIAVAGVTVHFWNSLFCLFVFLFGTGAWMLDRRSVRARDSLSRGPRARGGPDQ